jgi:hypothetical protein
MFAGLFVAEVRVLQALLAVSMPNRARWRSLVVTGGVLEGDSYEGE